MREMNCYTHLLQKSKNIRSSQNTFYLNIRRGIKILVLCIYVFLSLSSCNKVALKNNQVINQDITVKGSNNISLVNSNILIHETDSPLVNNTTEEGLAEILALLPDDYVLLEVLTTSLEGNNVESSEVDEHVILFANKNNLNVQVMIASYDKVTRSYNFIWQADTRAHGIDTGAHLDVKDITYDYSKEIIVFGVSKSGKSIIEVFQRPPNEPIQSYHNIFFKESDSIDLIEINRTQYTSSELESIGIEHQIITLSILPNGIFYREYYKWTQGGIFKVAEERFNQQELTQQKLSSLRQASNEDFKNFLKGGWVKIDNKEKKGEDGTTLVNQGKKNDEYIGIVFNENANHIVFFVRNTYQNAEAYLYSWQSSFRNMSRRGGIGLRISIKSNILPAMYDWIQLDIVSEDEIHVRVKDTIPKIIEGEYKRISNYEDISYFLSHNSRVSFNSNTSSMMKNISGLYKNVDVNGDNELFLFDYPQIKIITNDGEKNAIYTINDVNGLNILELKIEQESPVFYLVGFKKQDNYASLDLFPLSLYIRSMYQNKRLKRLLLEKES